MSKRMKELKQMVDPKKAYNIEEAVALVKKTSTVKFDASVEMHVSLGIDTKKSDQQIRATVSLPHGTGKTIKLAAFVGPKDEKAAKEAGADLILGEDDIKKIKDSGKIEFDLAVSTPEMMPKLAIAAKVLGPKGLMPNPKTETVSPDVKKMIGELKKGKAAFRGDDGGNVHQIIGKVSFSDTQLKENALAFIEALRKAKPTGSKGIFFKTITITSSMGPGIKVNLT